MATVHENNSAESMGIGLFSSTSIEPRSESNHDIQRKRSTYDSDLDVFVQKSGVAQEAHRYTIKKCFEGQEGAGFTSAVVLLVEPKDLSSQAHEDVVLKIFDHTVDTALRRRFITKVDDSDINQILEQALQDKSLLDLWSRFCEPIDVGRIQDKQLRRLVQDRGCPTLLSYGEFLCRHVIIPAEDSLNLQQRLVTSGTIPELTSHYRIMCYFLWLRLMFHAEISTAKSLPTTTILPRLISDAFIISEDRLSVLYRYPAIMLEYIQGTRLDTIERLFEHCPEQNSEIYNQLVAQNLPRCKEDVEYILMTILASRHRLLDMGFFYDDFHPAQMIAESRDQRLPVLSLVDYGAMVSVYGPDHEALSAWSFDKETLSLEVTSDYRAYCTIDLSLRADIPWDWECEITSDLPMFCDTFARASEMFRQDINTRFLITPSVKTTICARLIVEDVRNGAAAAGCDALTITLAASATARVLRRHLNKAELSLEHLLREVSILFAAADTEDLCPSLSTVSELMRQLDGSIRYFQSWIWAMPGVTEDKKKALMQDSCRVPRLLVLRWRSEQKLNLLVPQSCWQIWKSEARSDRWYSILHSRLAARVKVITTGAACAGSIRR